MNPGQSYSFAGTQPPELPFYLKALRKLPAFRGKARLARTLLTDPQKNRCRTIQDRYGNTMVVPNLAEPVGFLLGINGAYEPESVEILKRHLGKDADFVDVGANIGSYTVALAEHARRVIAIEASPAVLPFLRRNVESSHRSNIDIMDCAVSAPGTAAVPFYVPPMSHFGMGSSAPQFSADPISINSLSLDEILEQSGAGRVGAVKVDVEGYEAHVFLGSRNLLASANAPAVVFEFCDWAEDRAFSGRKGWAQQILMDMGYSLWPLAGYLRRATPLNKPITQGCHTIIGLKCEGPRS